MLVRCPACTARFSLDPAQLSGQARRLRCGKCQHEWMEHPPTPPDLGAPRSDTAAELDSQQHPDANDEHDMVSREFNNGDGMFFSNNIDLPPAPGQARRVRRAKKSSNAGKRIHPRLGLMVLLLLVLVVGLLLGLLFVPSARQAIFGSSGSLGLDMSKRFAWYRTVLNRIGIGSDFSELEIRSTNSRKRSEADLVIYDIWGEIRNKSGQQVLVPRLRATLYDEKWKEVQTWDFKANERTLPPGDETSFRTSVADPSGAARDYSVNFIR